MLLSFPFSAAAVATTTDFPHQKFQYSIGAEISPCSVYDQLNGWLASYTFELTPDLPYFSMD